MSCFTLSSCIVSVHLMSTTDHLMSYCQSSLSVFIDGFYYSKCKISYTNFSNKMANANSAGPEGLHCLPFHEVFCGINA